MTGPDGRPRVWVNCAISLDGRLAYSGGRRARLSGPADLARVHRLRADSDAILVGAGTIRLDDPSLRVDWERIGRPAGRSPLRVVLDSRATIPRTARVLDGSTPTLVATVEGVTPGFAAHVATFAAGSNEVDLPRLLAHLDSRGVRQLMVEGGSRVLGSFLRQRLVDILTVYVAPVVIGEEGAPSMVGGPAARGPDDALALGPPQSEALDDGVVLSYRPRTVGR